MQGRKYVAGPDRVPLSIDDLPSADTVRWTIRRKAEVVIAVQNGLLSLEAACTRYSLTKDEFLLWQAKHKEYGTPGLRTTRIQQYRVAA